MKSQDDLFTLIKSLSKQEKRYFKLYASTFRKSSNYTQLFDEINDLEDYDEKKIREKFKGETFLDQLHVTKNYLYHLILKSLNAYYSDFSTSKKIKSHLLDVELLYHKGLYKQCKKVLLRAKKLALKYEILNELMEINNWENKISLTTKASVQIERNIAEGFAEEETILNKMMVMSNLRKLSSEVVYLTTRAHWGHKTIVNQYKKLMAHPILKSPKPPEAFFSRALYYYIYSSYHLYLAETQKSYEYDVLLIEWLHQNPHQIEETMRIYIASLNNVVYKCIILKRYKEASTYLSEMKNLTAKYKTKLHGIEDVSLRVFVRANYLELTMLTKQKLFSKALSIIPSVEDGIFKYGEQINLRDQAFFYYIFANINFRLQKFTECLLYINKIYTLPKNDDVTDSFGNAQILELFCHFELENFDLFEYKIASIKRYFKKYNRNYVTENAIILFFRKVPSLSTSKEINALLLQTKTKIDSALNKDTQEKKVMEYFDFKYWLNMKLGTSEKAE